MAGYSPDRGNASRLLTTNHNVQRRVQYYMKKDSSNLAAQDILDHVYATFDLAFTMGQCSPALKALELLGKERGLWRDRRENVNINLGALSWEQTEQYMRERYGDKADQFITMLRQYYVSNTSIDNAIENELHVGGASVNNESHLQLVYSADENDSE